MFQSTFKKDPDNSILDLWGFFSPVLLITSILEKSLKISQDLQEKTCVGNSILIKLHAACNFIKKETPAQAFSCIFCRISNSNLFYRRRLSNCFSTVIVHRHSFHTIESWKVLSSKSLPNNTKKLVGENAKKINNYWSPAVICSHDSMNFKVLFYLKWVQLFYVKGFLYLQLALSWCIIQN